jgi:D-glycero-beta-D-manno-heptose-7-phosphate kinase
MPTSTNPNHLTTAKAWLERIAGSRMLVVGDVMIDAYIWGKVDRISPEAPVPVVEMQREEYRLGGAANVARNLKALGITPVLCGTVGADDHADQFRKLLAEAEMPAEGILTEPARPTTTKTRVLGNNQQMLRVDRESTQPLPDAIRQQLVERVTSQLPGASALIFEDYDKGLLDEDSIRRIIEAANALQVPILVDPKFRNFFHYPNVSVFKPNLKELTTALGQKVDRSDMASLQRAIIALRARMPHHATLVTLSEMGAALYTDETGLLHVPAHIRQINDVSGAGDTVISVMAAALSAGLPLGLCTALANLAGGLVCEEPGVVPVDKDRLETEATKEDFFVRFAV